MKWKSVWVFLLVSVAVSSAYSVHEEVEEYSSAFRRPAPRCFRERIDDLRTACVPQGKPPRWAPRHCSSVM
ncbi:unnamed protein product [Trichogramma brassicae]|uniref:Uncharacterized protein n=1 Tax=Trichogramma brassicae TaxID=86971 RepID=A0A6H5I3U0_9HYME|nr:unnamed protein product [Trichogramma brassicae]